ncbi:MULTISPECIES: hypothetical protein [Acinetobacter calcoaceticus/baumannii complex]|uniref:hypothetical protein n=1 Tax=Acinetobacter calcoaceticus/baumannii complex TaxID=909768 RepID=UPI00148F104B|nr:MULTISPECIES: hypothetical protein [Acinetobacter calcoaceticus/baumannii complex]
MDASAKPMSCRPYGVRTLSGQALGIALYKLPIILVGAYQQLQGLCHVFTGTAN